VRWPYWILVAHLDTWWRVCGTASHVFGCSPFKEHRWIPLRGRDSSISAAIPSNWPTFALPPLHASTDVRGEIGEFLVLV
jgi:hypothetical protein